MKLNQKQLDTISAVLDLFERYELKNTGVYMISGGFANADMFNYDEDYIDIQLKWGIQSDCENTVHTEQYKLSISVIDDDEMSIEDKHKAIEDA